MFYFSSTLISTQNVIQSIYKTQKFFSRQNKTKRLDEVKSLLWKKNSATAKSALCHIRVNISNHLKQKNALKSQFVSDETYLNSFVDMIQSPFKSYFPIIYVNNSIIQSCVVVILIPLGFASSHYALCKSYLKNNCFA